MRGRSSLSSCPLTLAIITGCWSRSGGRSRLAPGRGGGEPPLPPGRGRAHERPRHAAHARPHRSPAPPRRRSSARRRRAAQEPTLVILGRGREAARPRRRPPARPAGDRDQGPRRRSVAEGRSASRGPRSSATAASSSSSTSPRSSRSAAARVAGRAEAEACPCTRNTAACARRRSARHPTPGTCSSTSAYEEALERLLFAVEEMELALLTGEVGAGKTLLTRALVDRIGDRYEVGMILNPRLSPRQFLRTVAAELGVDEPALPLGRPARADPRAAARAGRGRPGGAARRRRSPSHPRASPRSRRSASSPTSSSTTAT